MSLTEVEFLRLLPLAVAPCEFVVQPGVVRVQCGAGSVSILFSVEPPRKLASLTFPVLKVAIEFADLPQQEAQAFLERFDRAYQRGGG